MCIQVLIDLHYIIPIALLKFQREIHQSTYQYSLLLYDLFHIQKLHPPVVSYINPPNLHLMSIRKFWPHFNFWKFFSIWFNFLCKYVLCYDFIWASMCVIRFRLNILYIMIPIYIHGAFGLFEFHEFKHEIQKSISKFSPSISFSGRFHHCYVVLIMILIVEW